MADRFIVLGADNSDLVVTPAQVPKTITYASLTPFEGTFPTFSPAPLVSVLGASHQRHFDVDTVGTTSFRIIAASSGGPPTSATLNIEINSLNVPAATPSIDASVDFPYYCSTNDVDSELLTLTVATASTGKVDRSVKRAFISQSYAEINACLAAGGYTLPVLNTVKQTITGAITASDDLVSFTITDESVFDVAKTVRLHGQSGNAISSEFTPIVAITGSVLTVEFAENSYNASSTCELCTDGFLYLRNCNTLGASYRAVNALAIKNPDLSDKAADMKEVYQMLLKDIKEGNILLPGLSKGGSFIETLQTNDSDENEIIFKISGDKNIF